MRQPPSSKLTTSTSGDSQEVKLVSRATIFQAAVDDGGDSKTMDADGYPRRSLALKSLSTRSTDV